MTRWLPAGLAVASLLCAGCRSSRAPAPTGDTVFRDLMVSGTTAFSESDTARAEHAFRAALTRAELEDHAEGIRAAAQNLAVVKLEAGDGSGVRELLDEAEAHAGTPSAVGEIRVLRARYDIASGEVDRARRILETVLADPADIAPPVRSRARLLLAELAVRHGDIDRARDLAARLPDPGTGADAARRFRLLAAFAEQEGDAVASAEAREREAAAWKKVGDWRAMALALERAGTHLDAAGQSDPAVETWLRAARSLAAQGDLERSRDILERCRQSGSAVDGLLMNRVNRLLTALEKYPVTGPGSEP